MAHCAQVMIPISFKVIVDISKSWISLAIQWDIGRDTRVTGSPPLGEQKLFSVSYKFNRVCLGGGGVDCCF